jgi:hypothetical protein
LNVLKWFRICSDVWLFEDVNKYLDGINGGEFIVKNSMKSTVMNDPGLYLRTADPFLT